LLKSLNKELALQWIPAHCSRSTEN